MATDNIVQKIWSLCNILRGDGVSYNSYIAELTYLLFLKIAEENKSEMLLPKGYRWVDLVNYHRSDLLIFYRDMLTYLGGHADDEKVRKIYAFPTTVFSNSENLRAVIDGINRIEWNSVSHDSMGDIYEGLIAKNSQDARAGAGQYFTPRALVESIVRVTQPQPGETIQDPATGSGGFLIAASQFLDSAGAPSHPKRSKTKFQGVEIEKGTYRLCLMNAFLHNIELDLVLGDALTEDAAALAPADVILANPPFGAKAGSARKNRDNLPFPTANKQLAFLQHIYLGLKPGGRAAVVLPDNVLFDDGIGRRVRQDLMQRCNLHTVLRLPSGIFYAQGVQTNVLFFVRSKNEGEGTKETWFYDMRANMPAFGKNSPLTQEHFADFEACYGSDARGNGKRFDEGKTRRFRRFSRDEIAKRDDNLDITWLRNDSAAIDAEMLEPEEIAVAIASSLRNALEEVEQLVDEFEPKIVGGIA